MAPLAKGLVAAGLILLVIGLALWGLARVPYVGRLPGDIYVKRDNFVIYFPLATCILISIIATILFSLMRR